MRLGIGLQVEAAIGHRATQPYRADHVLQRLARTHMHVHIAGGDQRHAAVQRDLLQRVLPQIVIEPVQQLQRQPESAFEQRPGMVARAPQGLEYHAARGHQQDLAMLQRREIAAGPAHLVVALDRLGPRRGDELAQVAPALQVVRQHHQRDVAMGCHGDMRGCDRPDSRWRDGYG